MIHSLGAQATGVRLERMRASFALLGSHFLPVHWGTFNLALHAWDEPAETLFALAPAEGVHLVMPLLGQPVEPSHEEQVVPWWHSLAAEKVLRSEPEERPSLPPPTTGVPWPMD